MKGMWFRIDLKGKVVAKKPGEWISNLHNEIPVNKTTIRVSFAHFYEGGMVGPICGEHINGEKIRVDIEDLDFPVIHKVVVGGKVKEIAEYPGHKICKKCAKKMGILNETKIDAVKKREVESEHADLFGETK